MDPFQERRRKPRYTGRVTDGSEWHLFTEHEEIRCCAPHHRFPNERDCGQYIGTVGPHTAVRVREVKVRSFDERRSAPRGQQNCPRCGARLELEWSEASESEKPAA